MSEQESSGIRVDYRDNICVITIDRPQHHNSITDVGMLAMIKAFDDASARKGLRAVVLTGAGEKTFCAGGHLKPSEDGTPFDSQPDRFDHPVALLLRAMERCSVPIVGRINGSAFGGGVGLICACDIAIGVTGSSFGTTEARVGVFPMMILPALLRVVPRRQLIEMCMYAEKFPAAKARELGILNDVVEPPLLDEAVEGVLKRLMRNSPTALSVGRRAINAATDMSMNDGLNFTQAQIAVMAQSRNTKEGFRAFAERREPRWE